MAEDNVKKIRDLNDFTSVNPMTTGDHLVVASSEGAPSTNKATIKDVVGLYLESSSGAGKWSDGTTAGDIYYNGGYVGIGTTDPSAALHVRANDDAENALAFWVVDKAHTNSIITAYENGDVKLGGFTYKDDTGRVGIGTTDPNRKIHVHTDTPATQEIACTSLVGGLALSHATLGHGGDLIGDLELANAIGNVKARITAEGKSYFNGGNVGIGTTDPSSVFEVQSNSDEAILKGISPNGLSNVFIKKTNAGDTEFSNAFVSGGTAGDFIFSGGSVGIGTTDPGAKLDIAGDDNIVHSKIENTSIDASSFAASVISGHLSAVLQLTSRSSGTDAKSFNIASQGGRLTIDVISDDGQTATRLMDIDASGNLRIKGTLQENSSF